MIKLVDIVKKYSNGENDLIALNGICLEIEDGEFIAVMGPSGSGKTTLLNILGCMDKVTSGEYYLDNLPVHRLNNAQADDFRKNHIGFVFQNYALLNDYTVRENVEIPLRASGLGKKKRMEKSSEMLKKVGILEYAESKPSKISGGQQQRAAIARALVSGASVILADEPTGALDSATGQEIMDLLLDINKEGKTIIIVTHDEKIAEQAQRVIRLNDGKIISQTLL
ncbi:MAG: ABC transporter ATP-binding protein [Lachnospiraceae bacterium]|nr:ABC transporter ATP-binding protein [Lachnospiraceae bacterium]